MKQIIFSTLIFIAIFSLFNSCKKENATEYMVYWNATTNEGSSTVNQEISHIYTAFDDAFAKTNMGDVRNHSIYVPSIPIKEITITNSEMLKTAAKANDALQDFNPTNYYTVTIMTSLKGENQVLATYYYGPREPGGDGDGDGDSDSDGDGDGDGNGDGNGDGDGGDSVTPGDGIVDKISVIALNPVFYAPLTNDLIDVMSGIAGTLSGSLGSYTEQGLTFNHNRVVWTYGYWNKITYDTPFTILVDYKRTGSNTEHMHIINSSPGPGINVERGFDIACRNGYQNNLITGVIKNWVNYGVTSPNTSLVYTQHILTGFIYNGNGLITRVQDGIITNDTYIISPSNFPDFTETIFCIGGLNNYYKDFWIGTIGNVMLFDRELSQANITSMQ